MAGEGSVVNGNWVRQARRTQRHTQADLAKAVGVSRQTIISIEQGDYSPSVYLAIRIAGFLGSTVEDLFYSVDPHLAPVQEAP